MVAPSRSAFLALGSLLIVVMAAGALVLATREKNPATAPSAVQEEASPRPEDEAVRPIAACSAVVKSIVAERAPQPQTTPPTKPAKAAAQIRAIALEVERIRELRFTRPVTPKVVTPQELSRRVAASVESEYSLEDAEADGRILQLLGAIPPKSDLKDLVKKAFSQQVIGLYDSDIGEIVVGTQDPSALLSPLARVTLAHELDHALTDQVLHLPDITENAEPGQEDAALAALALIEGDATMLMQLYAATSLSLQDQTAILEDPSIAGPETQEAELPPYIQKALEFPYLVGLGFACELFRSGGGWPAIDKAYKQPPKSTAQVIFPSRYATGELPVDAPDSGKLGEPWKARAFRAVGAADLRWLFEAPGGRKTRGLANPITKAAAWVGGEVQLFTREAASAVGVSLAQRQDNGSLCDSVAAWYRRSFPKDKKIATGKGEALVVDGQSQDAVVSCPGKTVRIGIAPDLVTARTLVK